MKYVVDHHHTLAALNLAGWDVDVYMEESFDYDDDGVLSPEEVLGDSEFAKLVGVDAEIFAAGIDFEGLGEILRNSLQLLPLLLQ